MIGCWYIVLVTLEMDVILSYPQPFFFLPTFFLLFSQHKEISSNTVTYIERSCQPPTLHPPHYSRSWMGVRIMLYSALPCVKKEEKKKYISTILFTAKSHCSHVPRFFHHTWQVFSWYIVNERVPDLLKIKIMLLMFYGIGNFL